MKTAAKSNFRYYPIKVQGMISECLSKIVKADQMQLLDRYEKAKYNKLYSVLLQDDGIPRLAEFSEKLKEQAKSMNRKDDVSDELSDSQQQTRFIDEEVIDRIEHDVLRVEQKLKERINEVYKKIEQIENGQKA